MSSGYPGTAYRRSSGAAPSRGRGFQAPRSVPSPSPARVPYRPPPLPANDNINRSLSKGLRFAARGLLRFLPWIGAAFTLYELWQWYTQANGEIQPPGANLVCTNGNIADMPVHKDGFCSVTTKTNLTSLYENRQGIVVFDTMYWWSMHKFRRYLQGGDYIQYYEAQRYNQARPSPFPNPYYATPAGDPGMVPRPLQMPQIDPMILPIHRPTPVGDPLPVRRPRERPNPYRHPEEQPRRYPRPQRRARASRARYPEFSFTSSSKDSRLNPRRNPQRRTRMERKTLVLAIPRILHLVLSTSEFSDVVNAVFDALPRKTRSHCLMSHKFLETCIIENWDKIDPAEAFENLVKNEIEDRFFGAVGKALKKSYQQPGYLSPKGYQFGPVF